MDIILICQLKIGEHFNQHSKYSFLKIQVSCFFFYLIYHQVGFTLANLRALLTGASHSPNINQTIKSGLMLNGVWTNNFIL